MGEEGERGVEEKGNNLFTREIEKEEKTKQNRRGKCYNIVKKKEEREKKKDEFLFLIGGERGKGKTVRK